MNPWIAHVKQYQAEHGCSYKEAMVKSKATYKKHGQVGGAGKVDDMITKYIRMPVGDYVVRKIRAYSKKELEKLKNS